MPPVSHLTENMQHEVRYLPSILVVDDEPEIRNMIALCLSRNNFHITCAGNAAEAFDMLIQKPFDAIISDVMMPGEDGIAFLGRVHESWPEIPVVLMTGHAQLQMAVNAIKNGAFDFVCKPFDFDHLNKIIMRALKYRELQRIEKNYRIELEETVARRTAELKQSMAELDFARTALQQAATDKSTFMSTISHEMRTPMNGVIGSLELLAEEGLTGVASEFLAMARQSAENMMVLIEKLLTFNNLTGSGPGSARYDLIDLSTLIKGLIAEQSPEFSRKGIALDLQIAEDVPGRFWTDKDSLSRVIGILLGNALKFSDHGRVTVSLSRQGTGDEAELLFAVNDQGTGIPDGMLEKIFEPFVQGDGSFTRRYEGVGLGLAIAQKNAMLLNGRLWAEHLSDGSSFKFSLKIIAP